MTKVWVYQSSRRFQSDEVQELNKKLSDFTQSWASHNHALSARGKIHHHQFLVLEVDESKASASGCSIDASVKFIQDLGFEYGTDFFDRLNFAYLDREDVKTAHKDDWPTLYKSGQINDSTIVFNNLVKTKEEMEKKWKIPLGESWHKNFVHS